jgi:hypothetical protein
MFGVTCSIPITMRSRKYYLIDGSFEGSWNYIPKDLSIACWYFEKRD